MAEEINYRQAGVDIDAGEETVERIKVHARSTFRPEVLQGLGGFGGLFAPRISGYEEPVLVAGTDGVGTKLKLAFILDRHDTIGIDCVAMSVNDILVQGAEPLFFLDYLAVGKLEPAQVEAIVSGVAEGCRQAGAALLGGETAEMPGFYAAGEYDLAGFAVGLVDRSKLIDGTMLREGELIIGLASSGLHSNGYSLARKVLLEKEQIRPEERMPGLELTLGEELLRPTTIYVKPVLAALKKFAIKGMAHITGGGLPGNLPRILPEGLSVVIKTKSWPLQPIFSLIAKAGPVSKEEMFRAFNMGIGYCLFAAPEETEKIIDHFAGYGLAAYQIGSVIAGSGQVRLEDL